jgi:hypothetical protein
MVRHGGGSADKEQCSKFWPVSDSDQYDDAHHGGQDVTRHSGGDHCSGQGSQSYDGSLCRRVDDESAPGRREDAPAAQSTSAGLESIHRTARWYAQRWAVVSRFMDGAQ